MSLKGEKTRRQAVIIRNRVDEGKSVREIAAELGVSRARVRYIAGVYNIPIARPRTRRFGFYASRRHADVVIELAAGAGVSPSTMLDRIVESVVGEGIDVAKRRLGKLALPTRSHSL